MTVPGLEARHTFTNADGLSIILNDLTAMPRYKLDELADFYSLPDLEDLRENATGRRGEVARRSYRRGVTRPYTGRIQAGDLDTLRAMIEDMQTVFYEEAEGRMDITLHPDRVPTTQRENRLANPSFELGTERWITVTSGAAVSVLSFRTSTAWRRAGDRSLHFKFSSSAGGQYAYLYSGTPTVFDSPRVTPGETITHRVPVNLISNPAGGQLQINWYNAAGGFISGTTQAFAAGLLGEQVLTHDKVAPAGAAYGAAILIGLVGAGQTFECYADAMYFGPQGGEYGDGDTPGWKWSGEAHASPSVRTAGGGSRYFHARVLSCTIDEKPAKPNRESRGHERSFVLALRLSDARAYDPDTIEEESGVVGAGTYGTVFPAEFPISFELSQPSGIATIDNPGRLPSDPVIDLYGPLNASPVITHLGTGRKLVFAFPSGEKLKAGQYLRIDFRDRTIYASDGVTDKRYWLDTVRSDWWDDDAEGILPGLQDIRLSAPSMIAPAKILVSFDPAYPA